MPDTLMNNLDATKTIGKGEEPSSTEICWLTISEASHLLSSRKISPVELTKMCLDRIERFNPRLNAFITVTADSALVQAQEAESEIRKGHWRGPLHGLPVALKDLFDTAGVRTTGASGLLQDCVPNEDSEVVRRLKSAGAVLLGKLNMHELAYGGSSLVSFFGPVRNPWSTEHIAGGSSAGSAVAVAGGLCYGALGSDTGGSIRQPSAYCGTVGLKPTYGRVSTRGVIPLSWSCDHVGPMTRCVTDAAIMLQALAGYDSDDPMSVDAPVADYVTALSGTRPLRIGVPRAYFYEKIDPEIESAMTGALSVIRKLVSTMQDVEMSMNDDTVVLRAEAYAYHFENVRKSPELYQPETLRRIRSGEEVTAVTYIQARRQMEEQRGHIRKVFELVDLVITPTTTVPPFSIRELLADASSLRSKETLMLRNTRPFNLLGLPTVSVPCGFTKTGLPIGMQIAGAPWTEGEVLRMAYAYQQQTSWHMHRPNLET